MKIWSSPLIVGGCVVACLLAFLLIVYRQRPAVISLSFMHESTVSNAIEVSPGCSGGSDSRMLAHRGSLPVENRSIVGHVRSVCGLGLQGIEVVEDLPFGDLKSSGDRVVSDIDGRFLLHPYAAGEVRLKVTGPYNLLGGGNSVLLGASAREVCIIVESPYNYICGSVNKVSGIRQSDIVASLHGRDEFAHLVSDGRFQIATLLPLGAPAQIDIRSENSHAAFRVNTKSTMCRAGDRDLHVQLSSCPLSELRFRLDTANGPYMGKCILEQVRKLGVLTGDTLVNRETISVDNGLVVISGPVGDDGWLRIVPCVRGFASSGMVEYRFDSAERTIFIPEEQVLRIQVTEANGIPIAGIKVELVVSRARQDLCIGDWSGDTVSYTQLLMRPLTKCRLIKMSSGVTNKSGIVALSGSACNFIAVRVYRSGRHVATEVVGETSKDLFLHIDVPRLSTVMGIVRSRYELDRIRREKNIDSLGVVLIEKSGLLRRVPEIGSVSIGSDLRFQLADVPSGNWSVFLTGYRVDKWDLQLHSPLNIEYMDTGNAITVSDFGDSSVIVDLEKMR